MQRFCFRRIVFFVLFLVRHDFVFLQDTAQSLFVDCLSDNYQEQVDTFLPDEFLVDKVLYDIDFVYDREELQYLTDIASGATISKKKLYSACFYLRQIDRFKTIDLVVERVQEGYALFFHLSGHLVFSHLAVSGSIRDKDFYKNMYLIDVSEVFDQQKHRHSLNNMKQMFYERGYSNARLVDTVIQDNDKKKVTVSIQLDKGDKFIIDNVNFHVESIGSMPYVDVMRMKKKIVDIAYKKLHHKTYTANLINKVEHIIQFLLERCGFINFDISLSKKLDEKKHTVDLNYVITLEQKKEFVFFGNHYFKRQEIIDHLLLYGKSSWLFPSSIIVDELVQLYKSKGFWNVSVSVREEKNRVFCLINEGARVALVGVEFKDNDHFTQQQLEKVAFKQVIKEKYYDKELLKKSTEQLLKFYKQHGFWDAQIVKEDFVTVKKDKAFDVVFTLDEGQQRKIGSYKVLDYPELEQQGPFVRIKKERGLGFDQMVMLEQKQWLLRHFRNLGYSKVSVEYELRDNSEQPNHLDLCWKITLREEAVKFGKVLVTGSSVVSPTAIMREVMFEQGQSWDKGKLEDTLKRLRELEVFDSVQIYPSREVDDNLYKPVFVKVIDADRYELRTRMGLQQIGKDFRLRRGFTYKLGGSFFIRNPLSVGDKISLEGDFTRYYRNFSGVYQFPWLLSRSIRCQYKAYDTLYNQPVYIGSKNALYQAGQRGLLFNMTKSFKKATLSNALGVEFMGVKESDQKNLHTIVDYDESFLDKRTGSIFFEPSVIWQRVDNILNPQKGHLSFLSCKGMIDVDTKTSFLKLIAEHSFYMPLVDPLVLAVRMRGGHVFNRNYNRLIPIERFYLGGANSVRGYERDCCPPLGLLTDPIVDVHAGLPKESCDLWRYAPQGGRTMFNLNLELRCSVYKNLGIVIFNDVGALFKDSVSNSLQDGSDNLLGGTGFGIRYDTPIGPLRFDLGFKWNRLFRDFESRWVWYLTLGHAF